MSDKYEALARVIAGAKDHYMREDIPEDGLSEVEVITAAVVEFLTSDEAVERAARAAAILGDYDGCFERIDEWNALQQWERDAHPDEEPLTEREDAEFWTSRSRVAILAAVGGSDVE